MMGHTRPIAEILEDPAADTSLKTRLDRVLKVRDFATRELGLPDNRSYRSYAAVARPFVTWNVYATPEFSLKPRVWCFPVAGCVAYRGYFSEKNARRFAADLSHQGDDVYVAGVTAYSTLGWFSDPLPSPVLRRSDAEVAGVIFHELAHQRLYLRGDSAFNESFAMTVELEGLRRWLRPACAKPGGMAPAQNPQLTQYLQDQQHHEEFVTLLFQHRARLEALYATPLSDSDKRAAKAQIFADLKQAYQTLKTRWGGYSGYDRWFAQPLNNAHVASVGLYHQHVTAFQALLASQHGDLHGFYAAAERLSRLPSAARADRLRALAYTTGREVFSTHAWNEATEPAACADQGKTEVKTNLAAPGRPDAKE
jgi:predicted aminopeptidase